MQENRFVLFFNHLRLPYSILKSFASLLSFHCFRHTFAVLALNYGMPIESVSKILGHTNITTTQRYAKVTNTKLEHDISMFESRVCERFAI